MATIDLNNYNVLDLLPLYGIEEEKKDQYIYDFSCAYADFITLEIGNQLKEEDEAAFEALLSDPTVEPVDIEEFFSKRINNFDAFLSAAGLFFKKKFLINVYKEMQKSAVDNNIMDVEVWNEIINEAQNDNWDKVYDLIRQAEQMEENGNFSLSPTSPPPPSPIPAVSI